MKEGSLRGSTLNLSSAALGIGFLTLSSVLAKSGFVLGGCMLVIGAFAGALSLSILGTCAMSVEAGSYTTLVKRIVGKWAVKWLVFLLTVSMCGSAISH
jgi:amino acid permease